MAINRQTEISAVLEQEVALVTGALGWKDPTVSYEGKCAYIRTGKEGIELAIRQGQATAGQLEQTIMIIASAIFTPQGNEIEAPEIIVNRLPSAGYNIQKSPAVSIEALRNI